MHTEDNVIMEFMIHHCERLPHSIPILVIIDFLNKTAGKVDNKMTNSVKETKFVVSTKVLNDNFHNSCVIWLMGNIVGAFAAI